MAYDELKIIQACQKGNCQQFADLYDVYVKKIYQFVYYKTHHKETAQDIVSDVFIKAMEKIHLYQSDKGKFSTWLFQIARNTVIDFYRAKKTTINIEDVWDLSDEIDIEKDEDMKLKIKIVEKYLKQLKPDQRELIIMRVWQDLSYKEIAQILGKTEASCKMSFSRAMTKLRQIMPAEAFLVFFLVHYLMS